jgi:hypothetical protein
MKLDLVAVTKAIVPGFGAPCILKNDAQDRSGRGRSWPGG